MRPTSPGAVLDGDVARFRVYAPEHARLDLVFFAPDGSREIGSAPTERAPDGYFAATIESPPSDLYAYRVDGAGPFPDPASRDQPFGVHGPSRVVSDRFDWTDTGWTGLALPDAVIYELHVGTATREGTFEALIPRLPFLRGLGVTAIELMPVASFPGRRGWGYDGVALFAPHAGYGGPRGLARLVDAAHGVGLAVLLDVVYNHLGPDGNYLRCYATAYFTDRHKTPWGDALDFAHPAVRAFFEENAAMWIRDFHLDGLRLDATHAIADEGDPPFLRELARSARAAAPDRRILIIAEDERNERRLLADPGREARGCALDAVWADDLHHGLRRAFAGDHDGYFRDYTGSAGELATTIRKGWLYEGQFSTHRGGPRGTPADGIAPARFVHCIQNHDQIGNRALGDRLGQSISPAAFRAASALLLLDPATPLLFMGQEWNATTPFLYFTDHAEPLGSAVREGRRAEFASFTAFAGEDIPDPQAESTFARCVLDWEEANRPGHAGVLALYRELLGIRARHPALRGRGRDHFKVRPLDGDGLLLQRSTGPHELFLLVNLRGSRTHALDGRLILHTEEGRFGGQDESIRILDGKIRIGVPGAAVWERGPG